MVFHNQSEKEITVPAEAWTTTDNPKTTQNELTRNMKFTIESRWKKFARIGILKEKDITFKECKTGEPIAAPGLSIVDGILYLSDPSAISELVNSSICLGAGPPVQIKVEESHSCHSRRWCAEYETETACEEACHAVTGEEGLKSQQS